MFSCIYVLKNKKEMFLAYSFDILPWQLITVQLSFLTSSSNNFLEWGDNWLSIFSQTTLLLPSVHTEENPKKQPQWEEIVTWIRKLSHQILKVKFFSQSPRTHLILQRKKQSCCRGWAHDFPWGSKQKLSTLFLSTLKFTFSITLYCSTSNITLE